jgi:hypothetical protein
VNIRVLTSSILALFLCSCASEDLKTGHGDAGLFILQHAVFYGGNPITTNGLPAITTHWHYSEDAQGVIVFMSRSDYSLVESFLRQAFGQPQFGPKNAPDGGIIGEYRLTSKGGGIQFSRSDDTEVIIIHPFDQSKSGKSR